MTAMFQRWVLFVLICAALLGAPARAMTMDQFARMKFDDEASYVAVLVEGSAKYLRQQGKNADADRLIQLFMQKGKGSGTDQFAMNVKDAYAQNMHNQINPNNRVTPLLIEDAMSKTLKNNGMDVPSKYLLTLYKNFKPSVMSKLQAAAAAEESDTNYPAQDAPAPKATTNAAPAKTNWFDAPVPVTPAAP